MDYSYVEIKMNDKISEILNPFIEVYKEGGKQQDILIDELYKKTHITKPLLELYLQALVRGEDFITVTSDPSQDVYIKTLDLGYTPIKRVLEELSSGYNINKSTKEATKIRNKRINFISINQTDENNEELPLVDDEDVKDLLDDLINALESDNDAEVVATTLDAKIETITFESLFDLTKDTEAIATLDKRIFMSQGLPDTLISGQDSYGNAFLKLQLLENELTDSKADLLSVFNEILENLAEESGFYIQKIFVKTICNPYLNFEVGSIVNDQQYTETLLDLADQQIVSKTTALTKLGLDYEHELSLIKDENEKSQLLNNKEEY